MRMDDDLDIPPALRLTDEARRRARENMPPPEPIKPPPVSVKRGQYPAHWLLDPGTRAVIAEQEAAAAGRKAAGLARLATLHKRQPPITLTARPGDGATRGRKR